MKNVKKEILAIVGPTATGKTALSVALAEKMKGEIICCDSMQIYDRMQIGTARPTPAEMGGVTHHLFGFCAPDAPFSCADYVRMATQTADGLLAAGTTPVFCGGTGLYLESLLRGNHFEKTAGSTALRRQLNERFESEGIEPLYAELQAVDPQSAAEIHPNNVKRVIRALEIYLATGRPKSVWDAESRTAPPRYEALIIGLDFADREVLRRRIYARVDKMLEQGLEQEARALWEAGLLDGNGTAAQAIGYKELVPYFRGEVPLAQAAEQIKLATARYAKRQLTYFRRMPGICWLYADETDVMNSAVALAKEAEML